MIGVITADDARAWCMAQPGALATDCRDEVASQLVDGVYCDGTIVMTAGAPKRCVPTSVLEAKIRAAQGTPLPPAVVVEPPKEKSLVLPVAIGLALVIGVIVATSR